MCKVLVRHDSNARAISTRSPPVNDIPAATDHPSSFFRNEKHPGLPLYLPFCPSCTSAAFDDDGDGQLQYETFEEMLKQSKEEVLKTGASPLSTPVPTNT